jgi:hypothetical protein
MCPQGHHSRLLALCTDGENRTLTDQLVSVLVSDECGVKILNGDFGFCLFPNKVRKTWDDLVFEERRLCCFLGREMEPYGTTLHINDRMMPVSSDRSRRQAQDMLCFYLAKDSFKSYGG